MSQKLPQQPGISMTKKNLAMWAFVLLVPVLVLVLALEAYLRLTSAPVYEWDKKLGWRAIPNNSLAKIVEDSSGNSTEVVYTTEEHGFREWGDTGGDNRILIVGDSYTADPYTSNDTAYFSILKNELNAEVFAGGGGGYGTLQELMLLEEYIDLVKPDIFLLQFCENDFINNGFDLETTRIVRNQKNYRPYLVNEEIVYRDSGLFRFLHKNSRVFSRIDSAIQQLQYRWHGGYSAAPATETERVKQEQAFNDAAVTTRLLLSKMHALAGKYTKHIFTINCNNGDRWNMETQRWLQLAEATGFRPLPDVTLALAQREKAGESVRIKAGGHWNDAGNEIIGKELAEQLKGFAHQQ
jgi:hypothetical protein